MAQYALLAEALTARAQRVDHAVGEQAHDLLTAPDGADGVAAGSRREAERRSRGLEPDCFARARGDEKRVRVARIGERDALGAGIHHRVEHGEEHLRAGELLREGLLEAVQNLARRPGRLRVDTG